MTVPDGSVFLVGDNAAASIDSRAFGPVPVPEVVGRVRFVAPPLAVLVLSLAVVAVLVAAGRRLRPSSR